jgi:hypothetical protein
MSRDRRKTKEPSRKNIAAAGPIVDAALWGSQSWLQPGFQPALVGSRFAGFRRKRRSRMDRLSLMGTRFGPAPTRVEMSLDTARKRALHGCRRKPGVHNPA